MLKFINATDGKCQTGRGRELVMVHNSQRDDAKHREGESDTERKGDQLTHFHLAHGTHKRFSLNT